jgi:hypothetical protein
MTWSLAPKSVLTVVTPDQPPGHSGQGLGVSLHCVQNLPMPRVRDFGFRPVFEVLRDACAHRRDGP